MNIFLYELLWVYSHSLFVSTFISQTCCIYQSGGPVLVGEIRMHLLSDAVYCLKQFIA